MTDAPDSELTRDFADRQSEAAFAQLVERHINLVYSVALRFTGHVEDARDVTQAVFIILAQKAAGLRERATLTGWLYETTRLTARQFLRGKIRRHTRDQEAYMQSHLNASATDGIWQQLAPQLEDAMSRLNENERALLALRYFENKTGEEAAALLGIRADAAHKRTARAVEKLRGWFTKRGVTLTATVLTAAISANSVQAAPVGLAATVSAAAAKGTVISATLTTLVNTTMKTMTWLKIKFAVGVGVAALLAGGTTTAVITNTIHSSDADAAMWNDDPKALDAAPPMVILRETKFPANRAGGILLQSGRLAIRRQPADELIVHAFNWSPSRTVVNTKLPNVFFDYLVTLPDKQEEALQQKIREQLGIVGRHETRMVKTYSIRLPGSPGRGLKISGEDQAQHIDRTNGVLSGALSEIQYGLECYLQAPVSLDVPSANRYLAQLKSDHFKQEVRSTSKADVEDISKAIQDQLGLEVVPTNRPIEMLVVEKVK